ncbi:unnamed protein product [Alternaria alternata]
MLRLFEQIRTKHQKQQFDGYCIEPDTVISCSELKLDNLIDESITISHHKKYFPPVTSHQGEVPIRVEDYLIDDDESDVSSMTGAFDSPVGDVETPLSGGTRDDTVQQFPSHSILNPALGPTIKESTISEDHPSAAGSPRTQVSFGSLQIAVPNDETHEKRLQSSSLTEEEAAEAEASILAVLDTLKSPHMTIEYLERFNTYITYVLTLWGRAPPGEQRRQFSVLSRLQDGLFRAEVLHGMCDIESQDSVFSSNLNYRDAMLKALGFVDSSVQKELESLGEVVMDAMTLFRGISDSNTRNAIRIAKKALRDQREVLKLETSERLPLSDSTSGSGIDNVKPFLTWVLVDAELDQKENTERVAAEYLHGMMREIEQSLLQRNEHSYDLCVAEGKQTDRRRYQLPDGLLDCFEETVLFLMQATTSVVAIRNEASIWKHTPGKAIDDLETPAVQSALEELGKLGESAQASMTRAEKAVVLAGGEGSTVSIGNAGPEFLVSIVLQNIARRHLLTDVKMDVNQLYQEYTSKLEYQIYQFPRKRLLRTIHKLQEELTVVQLVNSWQTKAFDNFLQILDPRTFKLPTSDRISLFLPESECISESLKSLQSKAVELEALKKRTQYLREQLKQSVEILEEDHGKAILMFTIITTIFLPLF